MKNRFLLTAIAAFALTGATFAADDPADNTPSAYAPFEHMVGGWKGTGVPAKNALKGWQEKHMWAWKFAKGKPVGMNLEVVGGKVFTKAALTQDPKTEEYKLDGTDPEGKPIVFAGKLDENGVMHLDRLDSPAEVGKERLDIVLNQNKIRYSMRLFRQEPGSPQFASVVTTNLGKEGESFAAGGAAADLPKCIVTGGAGTMTVSFQGKSFPICCTGCRDEFNDNPEKYMKKYLAKLEKGEVPAAKAADATSVPDEKVAETPKAMPKEETTKNKPAAKSKTETKPATAKVEKTDGAAKAVSLLSQAAAFEKSGKTTAALTYYKRIAKEFPDTPSAKTANTKIKALSK